MKKEFANYSKKLGKLGGTVYENMISYNISKKFFFEDTDYQPENKNKNYNANKPLDINKLKEEIISKLLPSNEISNNENIDRRKTISGFPDKLFYLNQFQPLNDKINQSVSKNNNKGSINKISSPNLSDTDSYRKNRSKSNPSIHKKISKSISYTNSISIKSKKKTNTNKKYKNITELEFGLFMKNVKGAKLIYINNYHPLINHLEISTKNLIRKVLTERKQQIIPKISTLPKQIQKHYKKLEIQKVL